MNVAVATSDEIIPGRIEKLFGVTEAFAQANPKTTEAMVKALIRAGKAYVCDLSAEEVARTRGSLTAPGAPSPWRDRPAAESLEQGNKEELQRLAVYLQDAMEDDPQFANELRLLAQEINAGKLQDNSQMTQNNYDNARGWQTKVEGGTAYIGEIHIVQPPS